MGALSERHPGKASCPVLLAIYLPSLLQNWDCLFLRAPPLTFLLLTLLLAPLCASFFILGKTYSYIFDYSLLENKGSVFCFFRLLPEQGGGEVGRKPAFLRCA